MELEEIKIKYPPYNKPISSKCKNMSGLKFGRLTVLYRFNENTKTGEARWVCQCECGNICTPRGSALRNGTSTSCGCLTYENASKANIHDLVGKKFGFLTVIRDSGKRKNHRVIWECKCKCGNIVERSTDTLIQGDSISCGCATQSMGAYNLEQVLKSNQIEYEKEKTFIGLVGKNKMPYRYDFYLPKYNRLVEFDGIQHYKERTLFKSSLKEIQERDLKKNQYALDNGYILVRIPYWKQETITLETILGEKYVIEE